MFLPKVSEHHSCTKNHGSGVGAVGSHQIGCHMTAARLEKCIFLFEASKTQKEADGEI